MTDDPKPDLHPIEDSPVEVKPVPTDADYLSLAERYANDEELGAEVRFVEEDEEIEYTYRICGHHGNCPCAEGEGVTTVTTRTYLADNSVYCEKLDAGYPNREVMEQAVIEDAVQNEIEGPGF